MKAVTHRLPVSPLLELVRVQAGGASSLEIAARLGVDRRTLQHWKHIGVSELQADRAAIAAGFHPLEVWPELADTEEAVSCLSAAFRRRPTRARRARWVPGQERVAMPADRTEWCGYCAITTGNLRRATGDAEAVAWCSMHACPVVVDQQKGIGPGLFITCGKPHTVAEHQDEETTNAR